MSTNLMRTFFYGFVLFALSSFSHADDYQFIDGDGVRLAYRSFGTGDPLILINGGPGRTSDSFTEFATALSHQGRQVILFDQRGTGRSVLKVMNEKTVTLPKMIDDLENIRHYLKIEKVNILGHSFGGMYAMAYAAKYPEHVKKLILSASGGVDLSWQQYTNTNMMSRLSEKKRQEYKFWTDPKQVNKNPGKARLEALRVLLPAYVFHQKHISEIKPALLNPKYSSFDVNGLVWKSMSHGRYDLKGAFANTKIPTLILDCRQDFLGEAVPLKIQAEIPGSRLEFLDECSHYPWIEKPNEYFTLIQQFLAAAQ